MMPAEPGGDEQAPKRGAQGDEEAGGDLDDADDVHGVVGAAGHDVVDPGREVAASSRPSTLANLSRPNRIGATVKPMRSSRKAWAAGSRAQPRSSRHGRARGARR